MLTRQHGYLSEKQSDNAAARSLERMGYATITQAFETHEIASLHAELSQVYASYPPDGRAANRSKEEDNDFRYQVFNRSPLAQRAMANPKILAAIEPLLGEDCHVIANTCWRNPAGVTRDHGGGFWHIDAGPHVPRSQQVAWDDRIPYPIFAIGCHIYVEDCPLESGPTGVLPTSHRSGQPPPFERLKDADLTFAGQAAVPLIAKAGDAALFVSDVWHRRLPTTQGDSGRFFLQVHYGRRDIAQRVLTTQQVSQATPEAAARATSERERQLLGLHKPFFYDG